MIRHFIFKQSIFLGLFIFSFAVFAKPLTITTSIKPLSLILKAIVADMAIIEQIVPDNQSPHTYQLKPSDQRKLSESDIVIWMGPELESFLAKIIANLREDVTTLQLLTTIDFPLRELDEGNEHEEEGHAIHREVDPHVWLSPKGGLAIAKAILSILTTKDPDNSSRYQANFDQFIQNVSSYEEKIAQKLEKMPQASYIVYHDAYGYFEANFGLTHVDVIALHHEGLVGAKHWGLLQRNIQADLVDCLFTEPQFTTNFLNVLKMNKSLKVIELDPLAIAIPLEQNGYTQFLWQLANQMSLCQPNGQ